MKVAVFGCGKMFFRFMSYKEKYLPDIEIVYVADNDKSIAGSAFAGIPVVLPRKLAESEKDFDAVLITTGRTTVPKLADQMSRMGVHRRMFALREDELVDALMNAQTCAGGGFTCDAFAHVFKELRPILPYVECDIVDHCNLNCRGCGHASNIAPVGFMDIDVFRKDMSRLSLLFENITKVRILGGEPLLHPRLTEFIRVARECFPRTDLRVATNGLLIPKQEGAVFEAMRENDACFDITCYLPTFNMLFEIKRKLLTENVRYQIMQPAVSFFKFFSKERRDPVAVFACCGLDCVTICRGRLSRCGMEASYERIAKRYGLPVVSEKDGRIDIYEDGLDGWELLRRVYEPFSLCGYCNCVKNWTEVMIRGDEPCFKWQLGEPNLSDWVTCL